MTELDTSRAGEFKNHSVEMRSLHGTVCYSGEPRNAATSGARVIQQDTCHDAQRAQSCAACHEGKK
jgi:hypothetical protein